MPSDGYSAWGPATGYSPGDVVRHGHETYIATVPTFFSSEIDAADVERRLAAALFRAGVTVESLRSRPLTEQIQEVTHAVNEIHRRTNLSEDVVTHSVVPHALPPQPITLEGIRQATRLWEAATAVSAPLKENPVNRDVLPWEEV